MNIIRFIKKYRQYLIAAFLVVVLALVGRFVASIDFHQFKTYLSEMPLMFVGVVIASFFAYLIPTYAWQLCMGNERKKVRFIDLFMIKHVGEMLTAFNPTGIIAGESVKAVYLTKRGVDTRQGLSSIIMLRVLIMISGIFLAVLSGVYLIVVKAGDRSHLFYIVIAVVLIILFTYLCTYYLLAPRLYLGKTVRKIQQKTGWRFLRDKTVASAYEVNRISANFFAANKTRFTIAFLLCVLQWICGAFEFYIILQMLGIDVSLTDVVAVEMGVIVFRSIGAVIPGQIGVEEYGNKVMLDAIGVTSNEVWLVATLMRRARQVFWLAVAGIFMIFISKTTSVQTEDEENSLNHA